jgi:hypothetical protein
MWNIYLYFGTKCNITHHFGNEVQIIIEISFNVSILNVYPMVIKESPWPLVYAHSKHISSIQIYYYSKWVAWQSHTGHGYHFH